MSRTGKKPVVLPDKVKAKVAQNNCHVEGPLGKLDLNFESFVTVEATDKHLVIKRKDDSGEARRAHGLYRALIQNMVKGVSEGFKRNLQIEGVGFRADVSGQILNLTLGFSHPINFAIPAGIKIAVDKQTKLSVTGCNRDLVGQVAANIRALRPPEPYKGKGIRYEDEVIVRKQGKAAAGAGGGK